MMVRAVLFGRAALVLFPLWGPLSWSACQLVATVDRARLDDGAAGANAGGSAGGGSCDPALCVGNDTDCAKRACDARDACVVEDEAPGTVCSDAGNADAKVCDGAGECVECNDVADCPSGELCDEHGCVPAICVNGALDQGETDVDCGGVCNPCDNGLNCLIGADCESGFCEAGTCTACSIDTECGATEYCDNGTCADQLIDGDACVGSNQCQSGFCSTDDVCCESACTQPCRACVAAKTGSANGACAAVTMDTDPDGECPANALSCRSGGCNGSSTAPACNIAPDGTVCRAGSGDSCDPSEICGGGNCPADVFANNNTVCRGGSGDTCDPDEECPGVAGMGCPANVITPLGTECRGAAGDCDTAEDCSGVAGQACPSDVVAAQGSSGTPSCTPYLCDGTSGDCPNTCAGNGDCAMGFTCNVGPNKCQ